MEKEIAFSIPFSGFAGMTFLNCFASTFMYMEGIAAEGSDYECKQTQGKACDSCGNCAQGGTTPIAAQEGYFFLFDTMCGRSSLRCRFDGRPTEMQRMICERDFYDCGTEETIDFLFGFAGYAYRKVDEPCGLQGAVTESIDAGRPLIAKVNAGGDRFRVITGYDDGGALICPDFTNAQRRPERAPAYGEIEALYVFDGRIPPRYTLMDGLRRIERVMAYNIREDLWGGYTGKMGLYTPDSLSRADVDEKKARMKRVAQTMWDTFNCHNFAEVFRRYRDGHAAAYDCIGDMKRLDDPRFKALFDRIGGPCYGYTHDLAWALIGLEECADWTRHAAGYFGEMVELTLSQIAKNDVEVLAAIREIISMLDE